MSTLISKTRILYCDDQVGEIPERIRYLKDEGDYEVDVAKTGTECLNLLRDNKYDALILDIMMAPGPEIDREEADNGFLTGKIVLDQIQDLKLGVAVLVVTAKPGVSTKREILDSFGLHERYYLEKPVANEIILERLKEALSEGRKGGDNAKAI